MELDKDKMDCCCAVCKISTKYGDSSGSCVLLQERLSYKGKLSKGGRSYQQKLKRVRGVISSFVPSPNTTGMDSDFHYASAKKN